MIICSVRFLVDNFHVCVAAMTPFLSNVIRKKKLEISLYSNVCVVALVSLCVLQLAHDSLSYYIYSLHLYKSKHNTFCYFESLMLLWMTVVSFLFFWAFGKEKIYIYVNDNDGWEKWSNKRVKKMSFVCRFCLYNWTCRTAKLLWLKEKKETFF